jgi:hypothetical protein
MIDLYATIEALGDELAVWQIFTPKGQRIWTAVTFNEDIDDAKLVAVLNNGYGEGRWTLTWVGELPARVAAARREHLGKAA